MTPAQSADYARRIGDIYTDLENLWDEISVTQDERLGEGQEHLTKALTALNQAQMIFAHPGGGENDG